MNAEKTLTDNIVEMLEEDTFKKTGHTDESFQIALNSDLQKLFDTYFQLGFTAPTILTHLKALVDFYYESFSQHWSKLLKDRTKYETDFANELKEQIEKIED